MKKYELVCIVGTGKLTINCMRLLIEQNVKIKLFDVSSNMSLYMQEFIKQNIEYYLLDKKDIFNEISAISEPMLLFSIYNPYIIPKEILFKENITAINLHHAL